MMETLLAVDLGLRTGMALYTDEGELAWFRSQNYGTTARLKRAVRGIFEELPGLRYLVLEGGGRLAVPWQREATRRSVHVMMLHAEEWRRDLLLPRERLDGKRAKDAADDLALRAIAWAGGRRPTSLRHDAAEAVLIGLWAAHAVGWIDRLPPFIR